MKPYSTRISQFLLFMKQIHCIRTLIIFMFYNLILKTRIFDGKPKEINKR